VGSSGGEWPRQRTGRCHRSRGPITAPTGRVESDFTCVVNRVATEQRLLVVYTNCQVNSAVRKSRLENAMRYVSCRPSRKQPLCRAEGWPSAPRFSVSPRGCYPSCRYHLTTTNPGAPAAPLYAVVLFAPVPAPAAPPPGKLPTTPFVPLFCVPPMGAAPPRPP